MADERTSTALRNVSPGFRTIIAGRDEINFNPGQTRSVNLTEAERDDAIATGWFGPADPLNHDADGEKGGSVPHDPPALSGKSKAELLEIAEAEDAEVRPRYDDRRGIKAAIAAGREG